MTLKSVILLPHAKRRSTFEEAEAAAADDFVPQCYNHFGVLFFNNNISGPTEVASKTDGNKSHLVDRKYSNVLLFIFVRERTENRSHNLKKKEKKKKRQDMKGQI